MKTIDKKGAESGRVVDQQQVQDVLARFRRKYPGAARINVIPVDLHKYRVNVYEEVDNGKTLSIKSFRMIHSEFVDCKV